MAVIKTLLALALLLTTTAIADINLPDLPRGKGEACVEPTELMRRDHMDLLNHQRDLTVHSGIRTRKHSLVECVECHIQRDDEGRFISINAPGQFCRECHAFAAVKVDCFECHATQPEDEMPDDHATLSARGRSAQ